MAWPRAGWWRTPSFATTSSHAPGSSRRQSRRLEPGRGPRSDAGRRWTDLREDGMYAISRYMQTVASKKRKRHRQVRELKRLRGGLRRSERQVPRLQRRLERRSRQLRSIQESRWWRLRPRLPKPRRAGH